MRFGSQELGNTLSNYPLNRRRRMIPIVPKPASNCIRIGNIECRWVRVKFIPQSLGVKHERRDIRVYRGEVRDLDRQGCIPKADLFLDLLAVISTCNSIIQRLLF